MSEPYTKQQLEEMLKQAEDSMHSEHQAGRDYIAKGGTMGSAFYRKILGMWNYHNGRATVLREMLSKYG